MNIFKTELNTTLNSLIKQREKWEYGAYKQANTELYAILEQCCAIYATLRADKANIRIFNALAEDLGINFNKGTSLALKIVRVVFAQQTPREFAYARVIKIGYDEKSSDQTLTNYIIERGGIENIRRSASKKVSAALSADDYRDIAENAFDGRYSLTTFSIEDYMLSDEENTTDYMVALVYCDGDGNGKVVYGSNKRTLVNTALSVIGKEIDDLQKKSASKKSIVDQKQQTADNVKRFVANTLREKTAA